MRALSLAVLILLSQNAWACGYCVEDKIASAYDHAVVTNALAHKHHVVFFHIEGVLPTGDAGRRSLSEAVRSVLGVDAGTVRVSVETATASFAFDPARAPLGALQSRIEKKLAARNLTLQPLRIMEEPADLKLVKR